MQVVTVLAAIFTLGADFGYGVTVEGIENQERLEASTALVAGYEQGFLFARPMPPEDVVDWLGGFVLPTPVGHITTPLGALAFHWSHTRGDGSEHPPREECPLTHFFSATEPQAAERHDRSASGTWREAHRVIGVPDLGQIL